MGYTHRSALKELIKLLDKFPLWEDYYIYGRDAGYDLKGKRIKRGGSPSFEWFPQKYSAWVERTIKPAKKNHSLEIEKTFANNQLTIDNLNETMRQTGSGQKKRMWDGRHCAETVVKK